MNELKNLEYLGVDPNHFFDCEKYVKALTPQDVQNAAKQLPVTKNVVTGILRPEKE